MAKKGIVAAAIIGIALAGLIGWRWVEKDKSLASLSGGKKSQASTAPSVNVATAGPQTIGASIAILGTVTSPFDVKVSAKVTGVLNNVFVREGDHVKVGQVLASLDPSSLTGGVLAAQANLAQAKSKLAEAKISFDPTRVGVSAAISQNKAALDSAQADDVQSRQTYQAQLAASQASVADANAKVAQAQSSLVSARAQLNSAKAANANAQTVLTRTISLYKQAFVAAQDVDNAKTAALQAESQVGVAESSVQAAQAGVNSAQALLQVAEKQVNVTEATGKSNIAASDAKLVQAKASLKLALANRAQNPAYVQNIEALQAAVYAAQAQVTQAQALLQETNLQSTIAGTVTARNMDPGVVASPGQTVVEVQYLQWVYVNAYIPIEDSSEVYTGQPAEVTVDGLSGKVFHGELSHISPAADSTSRQFLVQIKLENPGESLKPGMFGHVLISVQKVNAAVAVPREAITVSPDGTKVTATVVDDKNVVHVVPVTVGAEDSKFIQVLTGILPGQKVVTLTYNPLKDGQKVQTGPKPPASGQTAAITHGASSASSGGN